MVTVGKFNQLPAAARKFLLIPLLIVITVLFLVLYDEALFTKYSPKGGTERLRFDHVKMLTKTNYDICSNDLLVKIENDVSYDELRQEAMERKYTDLFVKNELFCGFERSRRQRLSNRK